MASKIILFHVKDNLLPELSKAELKQIRDDFYEELKNYPSGIRIDTYVNENGVGICDWILPDEIKDPVKTVEEIVEKVLGSNAADPVVKVNKVIQIHFIKI